MRDILFRAKRVKDGKWVEGFYSYRAFEGKLDHIIFQPAIAEYDYTEWGYLVDPTTVGQYTGLTDKNGKKIFEGDIVKCRIVDAMLIKTSGGNEKTEFIGPVKYINGSFYIVTNSNEEFEVRAVFEEDYIWEAEVIGNIHDNPELLKGDNNHDD